jgi:hypothetical protein
VELLLTGRFFELQQVFQQILAEILEDFSAGRHCRRLNSMAKTPPDLMLFHSQD